MDRIMTYILLNLIFTFSPQVSFTNSLFNLLRILSGNTFLLGQGR